MEADWIEVTCCFTDVEGSTQLLRELGPAPYQRVLNEHFGLLRRAFLPNEGIELGTSGDSMFIVFPLPRQALAGCLEAQRSLATTELGDGTTLRVRMGVHTGPVILDEVDGYVGLTVHQAARIMSAAHGGQVLLSAYTASLVPNAATWNLGDYLLKDIEGPVELHQLRHADLQASFPPVRARSAVLRTFPEELAAEVFVGRDREREILAGAWNTSHAGLLGTVLVGGAPGIGKTALVGRLASDVFAEGTTVLYGRCRKGLSVPYQPFCDALSQWTMSAPEDDLSEVADRWGPHLAGLLPDLAKRFGQVGPIPGSDPSLHRYHQLQGLTALLSAVATVAPMLLVLDDMQWADASSLLLLNDLALHGGALPALIVVTYRDTEIEAGGSFEAAYATLHVAPRVHTIKLAGLTADEVVQLVGDNDEGPHSLHRLTGGNPFLLRQVFATGRVAHGPLPLVDLVAARTEMLSRSARFVLSSASVAGSEFSLDVLANVTGLSFAEVLDAAEECANAQLVEEVGPGRYRFLHDLVCETIYSELGASRAAHYHGLVGDALERGSSTESSLTELSFHFARAIDEERKLKAVDYALAAGQRAWERLAFEAAIESFDSGLATLGGLVRDDAARRTELLLQRGKARHAAGGLHWAAGIADLWSAVDLAEEADDPERAAAATILLSEIALTGGRDARLSDQQLLCLARLEGSSARPALHTVLLAARGRYLAHAEGRGDEGRRFTEEALDLARTLGDPVTLENALSSHLGSFFGIPCKEREQWARELATVAAANRSSLAVKVAVRQLAAIAAEEGDGTAFRDAVTECDELRFQVIEALALGDLSTAENLVLAGVDRVRKGGPPIGEAMGQLAVLRWWQDRGDECIKLNEAALRVRPDLEIMTASLSAVLATSGNRGAARFRLERLAPSGVLRIRDDAYTNAVLAMMTDAIYTLGDPLLAAQLRERITPLSGRIVLMRYVVAEGAADRYLGMLDSLLGDQERAEYEFKAALELERRFGSTTLRAFTHLAYGQALFHTDHDEPAAKHAAAAVEAAEASGVILVRRRATDLLSQLAQAG